MSSVTTMAAITCNEDLRALARARIPRMFYDYIDSGSWTESTYRSNVDDLAAIRLRQRVAVNLEQLNLETIMAGQSAAIPVALAPTGLTGMIHPDGEIAAAIAAEKFGVPFTLSTLSICSIEDVAARTNAPFWFQLYVMNDRAFVARLIDRAEAARCSALVLTLDIQMPGQRHKDLKNGLSTPPKLTLKNIANMATKPRWCLGMARTKRRNFGNVVGHVDGIETMGAMSAWTARQFDPTLSWDDVARIRERWKGKLILKGILDADDARTAASLGADVLVVSNHGGRQMDGAPSTISALPAVVAAVGEDVEVWLDGGVRSGQDVLKALALGARATMIGRAFLYGLGAMGEVGVKRALELIAHELRTTMGFCGRTDIASVDAGIVFRP